MADYLKKFATQSEYDAYIQAGYPKPNVSYIVDNDEIIFTNYQDAPAGPDRVLLGKKIEDFTGTTFNSANTYITEAYIPDGVTTIADYAFSGCTALTSVNIPDSVTKISRETFKDCTSLPSVTIPDAVTSIGIQAFYNCSALTSATIGSSVTSIGDNAFTNCTSLTSLTVKATTPPELGFSVLEGTPSTMVIYVPAASVDAYKSADEWNTYANQIQEISE